MKDYDYSTEQSILGDLLSEDAKETIPKVVKIFGGLGREVFYSSKHRIIYQAVIELYEQNRKIHPKTVIAFLKDKTAEDIPLAFLRTLQLDQDVGAGLTEVLAEELRGLALRRKAKILGSQIINQTNEGIEIPSIVEFTETELISLKRESTNEKKSMTLLESLNAPVIESPSPIGGGFVVPERYTILAATDGEGKTTFCLQLALCAVTGTTFLGKFPIKKPVKVLYFCGENSRGDINDKARKQIVELKSVLGRTIEDDLKRLTIVEPQNIDFLLDRKEGRPFLNSWLESYKPDIVIFDPLNNFVSDSESLNNDTIARRTSKALNKIATDFKCFPILTTHFKKEREEDGKPNINPDNVFEMFHGSKYWTNPAVSQIAITRAHKQKYPNAKRTYFKFKTVTEVSPILLLRDRDRLWYMEISQDEVSKAKLRADDLVEILKRKSAGEAIPSIFVEIAAKELSCSQTQVRELLKVAKGRGLIVQKEGMLRVIEIKKQAPDLLREK